MHRYFPALITVEQLDRAVISAADVQVMSLVLRGRKCVGDESFQWVARNFRAILGDAVMVALINATLKARGAADAYEDAAKIVVETFGQHRIDAYALKVKRAGL